MRAWQPLFELTCRPGHGNRLAGAIILAFLLAGMSFKTVLGQTAGGGNDLITERIIRDPNARLLLEADRLIYDFDRETITAVGGVQVYYDGYTVEAAQLRYDQRSGRLIATGGVRVTEPGGNVITAREMDITDDFRDGFIESLNVETAQRARFSANSAERRDGNITIFNRGTYTACEKCEEHPDKPPLWQIKAATIIHDQNEKTVRYEDAKLEFLGIPIAYVPFFSHADPSVKRKSGFLLPNITGGQGVGIGLTVPYFFNLAPNYDITFSPTVYSRQGFLGQLEWRHRVMSGSYKVRLSGIRQNDKNRFIDNGMRLSGFRDFRGSIQSSGNFYINPRWMWGWDLIATSDRAFGRDYSIEDAQEKDVTSSIYLTGQTERNYFDVRALYFRVQRENTIEEDAILMTPYEHDDQAEQAFVHPVMDHNYVVDRPVAGGELRVNSNVTSLTRQESDIHTVPAVDYYAGVAGSFARASTDVSWQRTFVGIGGQVLTPFAYVKADLNWVNSDDPASGLSNSEFISRAMPAVGAEYRWPFLITSAGATQTISPIAQLIVRPDESHIGELPNEDAQSLVFDDTILFERDKFSGYDRQEGGVRANLGFSYQARFNNGVSIDTLVGQSFQLAGTNSFARTDLTLTGSDSGLEDDRSDYIGRVTVDNGHGLAVTARGRFDNDNFSLNRGEIGATAVYGRSNATVAYTYLRHRPDVGIIEDRREFTGAAKIGLNENWSVSGALVYDIENTARVEHQFGLAYDDECFNLSAVYSETRDRYSDVVTDQKVLLRVNLRTIGDSAISQELDQ